MQGDDATKEDGDQQDSFPKLLNPVVRPGRQAFHDEAIQHIVKIMDAMHDNAIKRVILDISTNGVIWKAVEAEDRDDRRSNPFFGR